MNAHPDQLPELHLWTEGGSPVFPADELAPYLRWHRPGDRVVDLGCGDGRGLRAFAAARIDARGVELNAELAALCQADGLRVTQGDAREYLAHSTDWETVSMLDFVEHIPLDVFTQILGTVAARPGARVWIQTPNLDSLMGFKFWFHMPSHISALHPWVLRKILQRRGFVILEEWTQYGGLPWTGWRRRLTIRLLNSIFGPVQAALFLGGANICLVAEARPAAETGAR